MNQNTWGSIFNRWLWHLVSTFPPPACTKSLAAARRSYLAATNKGVEPFAPTLSLKGTTAGPKLPKKHMNVQICRPPKFNSEFAPEKWWLEDDPFLLGRPILRGYVKLPGGSLKGVWRSQVLVFKGPRWFVLLFIPRGVADWSKWPKQNTTKHNGLSKQNGLKSQMSQEKKPTT